MSLKEPKHDASHAEWEQYSAELDYRAFIEPFFTEPKHLQPVYKKTNK